MFAYPPHVLRHASILIADGVPFDEMTGGMSAMMVRVGPLGPVEGRRAEVVLQQVGYNFISKEFHAAIRMMNDEPLQGAQEFVRYDKRTYRIICRPAARIADDMRVAFGKPSIFGGIESRVHASQNREASGGRQRKVAFRPKRRSVGLVGGQDFFEDFRHGRLSGRGGVISE